MFDFKFRSLNLCYSLLLSNKYKTIFKLIYVYNLRYVLVVHKKLIYLLKFDISRLNSLRISY